MKLLTHKTKVNLRCPRMLERGAVAVEFAFVSIVIMMMTAGIVEFGRVFWYYNALDKATRDAARYISALPATDMMNSVNAAAAAVTAKTLVVSAVNDARVNPPLTTTNVSVICDPACNDTTKPITVTVRIDFPITIGEWFPFVKGPSGGKYASIPFSPYTTMPYMN